MKSSDGLVIIYTGEGKGKTTAGLGLVLRSLGYGRKVLIIQFGKNSFSGELKILKQLKNLKIIQGGKGFVGILGDKKPLEEHKKAVESTFNKLKKEIISGQWDLVIADEIIGAVFGKLLGEELVLDLIERRPKQVDLVLTGRGASQRLIDKADLVSEIKSIKHPFQIGQKAKAGIDF